MGKLGADVDTDVDFDIEDADAERLLNDAVDDDDADPSAERPKPKDRENDSDNDDEGDPSQLRDPGKRALDAMKRERNAARKELADARKRLKDIDDKGKTDTERLTEAHKEAASRAEKAESSFLALTVAMDRAPAHATLEQVRKVAKRIRGESEEELEADADELFEMVVPAPKPDDTTTKKRVPTNPRTRLRGGADPEEEPEENNPRKLADAIRHKH
jgi:hypothetical protein